MTYYLCLLAAIAIVFSGCAIGESQPQKENSVVKPNQMGTFEGENKTLGNGTAYSWVTLDREGNPSSIGVNFTESALKGLPEAEGSDVEIHLPYQKKQLLWLMTILELIGTLGGMTLRKSMTNRTLISTFT